MATTKAKKTANRFGARYGRRLRDWLGSIEQLYRTKDNKCPYCKKEGVRRKAVGIWNCPKCEATFAGRAYTPGELQ